MTSLSFYAARVLNLCKNKTISSIFLPSSQILTDRSYYTFNLIQRNLLKNVFSLDHPSSTISLEQIRNYKIKLALKKRCPKCYFVHKNKR